MTNAVATNATQPGDLLLDVLPPDGSPMGNPSNTLVEHQQTVLEMVSNPDPEDDQGVTRPTTRRNWKIRTLTPRPLYSGCLPMPVGSR